MCVSISFSVEVSPMKDLFSTFDSHEILRCVPLTNYIVKNEGEPKIDEEFFLDSGNIPETYKARRA